MKALPLFLTLIGCSSIPVDGTPPWTLSNRFSGEMYADCNSASNPNIGLSGCVFTSGRVAGNITFPALFNGKVNFISSNCKNASFPLSSTEDTVIKVADLYTANNGLSCSFEVTRTFMEQGIVFDSGLISRFTIKIIENNPYYSKMRFNVAGENFTGVGWYQKKSDFYEASNDAVLKIKASSEKGIFRAFCGADLVAQKEYTTKEFEVNLESDTSCDYELSATSSNAPVTIDLGTYLHEVNFKTIDISLPVVNVGKNIQFVFNDRDNSGKHPVVIGVKIDNTLCKKTNSCSVINNRDSYTVRAMTPSGRFFWGRYKVSTKSWLIK